MGKTQAGFSSVQTATGHGCSSDKHDASGSPRSLQKDCTARVKNKRRAGDAPRVKERTVCLRARTGHTAAVGGTKRRRESPRDPEVSGRRGCSHQRRREKGSRVTFTS